MAGYEKGNAGRIDTAWPLHGNPVRSEQRRGCRHCRSLRSRSVVSRAPFCCSLRLTALRGARADASPDFRRVGLHYCHHGKKFLSAKTTFSTTSGPTADLPREIAKELVVGGILRRRLERDIIERAARNFKNVCSDL